MRVRPQQAEGLKRYKQHAMKTQARGGPRSASRDTPALTFSPLAVEDLRAVSPDQRMSVFSAIEQAIADSATDSDEMTAFMVGSNVVWLSHLPSGWVVERIVPTRTRTERA